MKRIIAIVLCAALTTTGCASAAGPRFARTQANPAASPVMDRAVLADYLQRLPIGSRVKLERTDGSVLHGTLMKVGTESVVVQKNTRVPEPPIDVPLGGI